VDAAWHTPVVLWTLVLVALAVAVASYAQAVSGFGFALIASPLIATMEGPKAAVVGGAVVATLQSLYVMRRLRPDVAWRAVAFITGASLLGMPLGLLIFSRLSKQDLTAVIGILVLAFALLLWRGWRLPDTRLTEAVAGVVSGTLATSTGTSGPPIVITFHGRGLEPNAFRASLAGVFTVQGLAAIGLFAAGGKFDADVWRVIAVGTPAMVVGWLAGNRTFDRIDPNRFRKIVLGMLVVSGLAAVVDALLSA
jgi:Sulfite exporter TauE/SafE.